MANDGPPSSQYIVINDSEDEEELARPGPSSKKAKGKAAQQDNDGPELGGQSQPISIIDLDSDNGQDAIDVLFGNGSEAGVFVEAAEGAVLVTNTTIIAAEQADLALPLLLNILPDLDPEHGLLLLRERILNNGQSFSIEHCLQTALEHLLAEDGYPKVQKTLKRKRVVDSDDDEDVDDAGPSNGGNANPNDDLLDDPTCRVFQPGKPAYKTKTFLADERKGTAYNTKALVDLENLFPTMAAAHIRCIYSANAKKFAPTYIALKAETLLPDDEKPYVPMKQERAQKPLPQTKASGSKKGKKKMTKTSQDGDAGYDAEREWFILYLMHKGDGTSIDHARVLVPSGEGDTECGCCFGDEEQAFMVQCAEGHNFCRECIRRMTEVAVGAQTANVVCPHTDGCDAKFHDRDLRKALSVKLYNTYSGIIQRKELEDAGIEGLESCPYCNFMIIVENQEERLFTCQSDDCGKVSCRACGKSEHLPKTCEEAAKDNVLDHRHAIEEAMSEALIRKCPKCSQACVKDAGCNKMRCNKSGCNTMFCNVCRATITGYEHFDQTPADYRKPKDGSKCRLWDPVDKDPYLDEVAAAREAARQQVLEDAGADVAQGDIDVALPEANVRPRHGPYPGGIPAGGIPAAYMRQFGAMGAAWRMPGLPHADHRAPAAQLDPLARLDQAHQVIRDQLERLRDARNRDPNEAGRIAPMLDAIHAGLQRAVRGQEANAIARQAIDSRAVAAAPRPAPGGRRVPGVAPGPTAAERLAQLQRLRDQVAALRNEGAGANAPRPGFAEIQAQLAQLRDDVLLAGGPNAFRGNGMAQGRAVRFQDPPQGAPLGILQADVDGFAARLRALQPPIMPPNPAPAPAVAPAPAARPARQRRQLQPEAEIQQPDGVARFAQALARAPGGPHPWQDIAPEILRARIAEIRQRHENRNEAVRPGEAEGLDAQAIRRFAQRIPEAEELAGRVGNHAGPAAKQQDGNQNFVSLEQAKLQFETTMRAIQREFPLALQQGQIIAAARQRSERTLPARVADDELAAPRRISPRQPNEVQVDPISVLLLLHQRHAGWCQQYYEYLIGVNPVGPGLHAMFNRYVAAIIDNLREGKVQAPIVPAQQRTTFHVLRQPHSCWNIGATNLITLLARVMANSGSVFPPERPIARTTVMFQNLLINLCPERIMLAHHRIQLEHLLYQRLQFRNRAAAPARAQVNNGGNRHQVANRVEVEIPINRPLANARANARPDFEVVIPDEAPPPYEAVEARRAGRGGMRLRAGRPPT